MAITPATTAPHGFTSNLIDPPSIASRLTTCSIACSTLCILIVSLRIYTRAYIVRAVGWDDYVVLFALALWLCDMGLFQRMVAYGLGRHLWDVPLASFSPTFLKIYFSCTLFYSSCMFFAKLSILLLYLRLFPIQDFMWKWWAVMFFTFGYSIAGVFVEIFACTPISAQWNIFITESKCISKPAFYIANGVINSISDLLILALPIPVIWGLALNRRKKITLSITFALGSTTCIFSIIRLKSIIVLLKKGNSDLTYDLVDAIIWSEIETAMCIICSCVPTFRPFFDQHFKIFFSTNSGARSASKGPYIKTDDAIYTTGRSNAKTPELLDNNIVPYNLREDYEMGPARKNQTIVTSHLDSDTDSTDQIISASPPNGGSGGEHDRILVSTTYQVKSVRKHNG